MHFEKATLGAHPRPISAHHVIEKLRYQHCAPRYARVALHESPWVTKRVGCTDDRITFDEVERITI